MTTLDHQIFTGYITSQLVLGGWLAQNPVSDTLLKLGLFLVDLTLSGVAGWLLYSNYRRRTEVVGTIKNLNEAFGFTKPNIYLQEKAINAPTIFRPWVYGYLVGVIIGALGDGLIIFAPPTTTSVTTLPTTDNTPQSTSTVIPTLTPFPSISATATFIP